MYKHVQFDLAPSVYYITFRNRQNSFLRPSMNDVSNISIGRIVRVGGGEFHEEAFECRRSSLPKTYDIGR